MSEKNDDNWIRGLFQWTAFDSSKAFVEESGTRAAAPSDVVGSDILTLLEMLSAPLELVAQDGARMLLSWMETRSNEFAEAVGMAVENPLDTDGRKMLLDRLRQREGKRTPVPFALSGERRRDAVSLTDAVAWLQSSEAVYTIVWSAKRFLIAAEINGIDTASKSVYLDSNSEDRLLLVSRTPHARGVVKTIREELKDFCTALLPPQHVPKLPRQHSRQKEAAPMKTHNGKKCVPREYARRQESVEPDLKILLAKAALQQMRDLRDGEGLVVDAGSSCLAFFKEYAEMIRNEHKYLSFYTNSYQILECWLSLPDGLINEIPLEILGSKLDCMHLAFHGDVAKVMLNPRVFKPAVVVIGASGIMFDSEEGLLFSYHASSPEEKFKQLLFQCVATKKRIILGTASKIGFVGAYSFDLLSSDMFDTRTPICLITTAPRKDDTETAERFYKMREVFYSRDMQDRVQTFAPGLNFEWIVLDPEKGDRMFDEFDKEKRPVAATPSSNGCRP